MTQEEKITLQTDDGEAVDFYVLEETRINGMNYLMVTDAQEEEDGECYVLKDVSGSGDSEAVYEFVENDDELDYLYRIFTELLEDADVELKKRESGKWRNMEQERFKETLRRRGLKVTNQRLLVLETIADRPGQHLTAEEIYELTKEKYPEIGLATIYRTVQVLVELGVIDKVSFDDGFVRYELGDAGQDSRHHHHHAICQNCGRVFSFEGDLLETLEEALYDTIGFVVTDHEVKLTGYCRECAKGKENNMEEIN